MQSTQWVVLGGLALGIVFGALGQWSRFCVRGAIADWVEARQPARLSSWLIALATAAIGTQLLVQFNLFDISRTNALNERFVWLSYLVGGALFGYGMILARGCPQRSLVKAGSGDMRAVVTLLVAAITAAMTLRGLFAEARVQGLESKAVALGMPQDGGSLLAAATDIAAGPLRWLIIGGFCVAVVWWLRRNRGTMNVSHWLGGALIGLLVPAAWYLTGHIGFAAEHPETLEAAWLGTQTNRPEALSFTAPLANTLDLLMLWSDKNTVATFGVMLVVGVLLGSVLSALLRRDFRLENFQSPGELVNHLIGGTLMGFGGVTAMGCSIGQGLTGLSTLSAGAALATAGIVAGAWAALRVQLRRSQARPARRGVATA
ncbi:YeeE/YedE family protein [Piscinibacter sakaiensis]|uniref:YeeE/YedE family protein n=1 Tax=Piscinibacter sakaiensis TaxID=1547922 RepID=UPI003AB0F05E